MRIRTLLRTAVGLFGPARPLVLFHKPTARCDCRCRFCDSWVAQPKSDDVLPAAEILSLLEEARAAGMTTYTVWGGEPLLAADLPVWLKKAQELSLQTVVCTSGFRLAERADELAPFTDRLLVSLEAVGEKQDQIRGTPGLFSRLVAGISEFQKHGRGQITLWSNLSRENQDQPEVLARFAAEQGITVEFFPAAHYPGYNEKILLSEAERGEIFSRILELKKKSWPVLNTSYALSLMRSGRTFRCNIPRLSVQVMADGKIFACEPRVLPDLPPYGGIGEVELRRLSQNPDYLRARQELASCNRCLLPCVANAADDLVLQSLRKAFTLFAYHPSWTRRTPPS